jgi:hypothetical protein
MPPYELEALPHTLKKVQTQPIFVIRLDVLPIQVIGKTAGAHRRVAVIRGGNSMGRVYPGRCLAGGVTGSLFETMRPSI